MYTPTLVIKRGINTRTCTHQLW